MSNPGKINEITVTVHLTNQQYTDVQIERIEIAAPQSIKCTVTVIPIKCTVTVIRKERVSRLGNLS
jgi:hypothetical protein